METKATSAAAWRLLYSENPVNLNVHYDKEGEDKYREFSLSYDQAENLRCDLLRATESASDDDSYIADSAKAWYVSSCGENTVNISAHPADSKSKNDYVEFQVTPAVARELAAELLRVADVSDLNAKCAAERQFQEAQVLEAKAKADEAEAIEKLKADFQQSRGDIFTVHVDADDVAEEIGAIADAFQQSVNEMADAVAVLSARLAIVEARGQYVPFQWQPQPYRGPGDSIPGVPAYPYPQPYISPTTNPPTWPIVTCNVANCFVCQSK